MPNCNKVQFSDGTVLIDLTSDTITPNDILYGVSAHDASGSVIQGTLFQDKTQTEFLSYDISDSNNIAIVDSQSNELSVSYHFSNDRYSNATIKVKDLIIANLEERLNKLNEHTIIDSFGENIII